MKIPFLDLKAQYESIKGEIGDAIQQVLDSCAFAGGPFVEEFEKNFAKLCGCKHALGVGSGTEALWMALLALGVGPGDEVITVPNTFIATAEAITFCGVSRESRKHCSRKGKKSHGRQATQHIVIGNLTSTRFELHCQQAVNEAQGDLDAAFCRSPDPYHATLRPRHDHSPDRLAGLESVAARRLPAAAVDSRNVDGDRLRQR